MRPKLSAFIYLFFKFFIRLAIYSFIYLFTCFFVYLFNCSFICVYAYLCSYSFVYLFTCLLYLFTYSCHSINNSFTHKFKRFKMGNYTGLTLTKSSMLINANEMNAAWTKREDCTSETPSTKMALFSECRNSTPLVSEYCNERNAEHVTTLASTKRSKLTNNRKVKWHQNRSSHLFRSLFIYL